MSPVACNVTFSNMAGLAAMVTPAMCHGLAAPRFRGVRLFALSLSWVELHIRSQTVPFDSTAFGRADE